ncbi:MAG: UdgX family uracil-DNA binding protein [Sphingobium sp.]|uniref:UdgX family uracil-DNA binding protein n=1 Tax=Sphingobium sp. TaxID=1912891 RepID=UPI0029BB3753|nr:UdgX family uracil-DNA binding protein [Sphingobium sp.]MDX3911519.1 UdgX family uracil-DNA binding protein [Sphingobium sp.]
MRAVQLEREDDFDGWRAAARSLVAARVPAEQVVWQIGAQPTDLFAGEPVAPAEAPQLAVPKDFLYMASRVVLHANPERFSLLYALLLRILDEPHLMRDKGDRQLRRALELFDTIRRDMHKMRAFVRFREVEDEGGKRFVAWFEPEHHIVRANAAFFVGRFTNMRWSILTPRGTIHWDTQTLKEGPPATRVDAPGDDPVEAVWKAYYSAIFNPARLMPKAMTKEMPKKYWKNMPETALVAGMIAGARKREVKMIEEARMAPAEATLGSIHLLREEAQICRRCQLWQPATQIVFGDGPAGAEIMIVGEQPGDEEDVVGKPFVGPAGKVFDRALVAAGIDRARVYVTNAVKHFKFEPRGKRRIHARPNVSEIDACRWWLDQEQAIVKPKIIIAMGATAARAVTGRAVTISRERGCAVPLAEGVTGWITVHPSYLLRLPPEADAAAEFDRYVDDLRTAANSLAVLS